MGEGRIRVRHCLKYWQQGTMYGRLVVGLASLREAREGWVGGRKVCHTGGGRQVDGGQDGGRSKIT